MAFQVHGLMLLLKFDLAVIYGRDERRDQIPQLNLHRVVNDFRDQVILVHGHHLLILLHKHTREGYRVLILVRPQRPLNQASLLVDNRGQQAHINRLQVRWRDPRRILLLSWHERCDLRELLRPIGDGVLRVDVEPLRFLPLDVEHLVPLLLNPILHRLLLLLAHGEVLAREIRIQPVEVLDVAILRTDLFPLYGRVKIAPIGQLAVTDGMSRPVVIAVVWTATLAATPHDCFLLHEPVFAGVTHFSGFFLAEVLLEGDLTHPLEGVTEFVVRGVRVFLKDVDFPLYILDHSASS